MSEELTPNRKAPRKTGLGRGLGSLLGEGLDDVADEGFQEKKLTPVKEQQKPQPQQNNVAPIPESERIFHIALEKLVPNKEQPRKDFTPDELKELSDSIAEKGVIQPILARRMSENEFQIIAGERRWRASALAGLKKVPVILKDTDAKEVLELALIENIQRQDLNPMEEAEAYQMLSKKYQMTQQEIADKVGKERATVANVMRLMQLGREVREMVKQGDIQLGQAKALMGIQDLAIQKKLAKQVSKKGLSVRALERLIKKISETPGDAIDLELDTPNVNERLLKELSSELSQSLGTKVRLDFTGRKGKMQIDFYSIDELNNIVDRIRTR